VRIETALHARHRHFAAEAMARIEMKPQACQFVDEFLQSH
jgi:hypothetical protein